MRTTPNWSQEDDAKAWAMLRGGKNNAEIGEALRRTPQAVAARLSFLGWTSHLLSRNREGADGMEWAPDGRPMSPEKAWGAAWAMHHGNLQYEDVLLKHEGYHRQTRSYGADIFTMGGVATYG